MSARATAQRVPASVRCRCADRHPMFLAGGTGRRNPHRPAHTGRRRQPRRRRRRGSLRGRRIGSLINALTLIGVLRGDVPVGVADIHIPRHRVVNVILGQVEQGIPWAPVIWAVADSVDLRRRRAIINRLGGTCAQPRGDHTARHQDSRCEAHKQSLHRSSFRGAGLWPVAQEIATDPLEDPCGAAQPR
jgi:hypothetical protein